MDNDAKLLALRLLGWTVKWHPTIAGYSNGAYSFSHATGDSFYYATLEGAWDYLQKVNRPYTAHRLESNKLMQAHRV